MDYSSSQKIHGENGKWAQSIHIWVFPKNSGTPKWMVCNMDGLGVPLFLETPIYSYMSFLSA